MNTKIKLGIGILTTGASAYLLYCGIHGFTDVLTGVSQLGESMNNLKDYVANANTSAIENAKILIGTAQNYLLSHAHIFSHTPNADNLDSIIKSISTANNDQITNEIIPAIEKVKESYSGSGNCPIVKLFVPGLMTAASGIYTLCIAKELHCETKRD